MPVAARLCTSWAPAETWALSGVLADHPVTAQIGRAQRRAGFGQIAARGEQAHIDPHQLAADQIGLAWLLHADRHIGFAHRQVEHAFLEHQIDPQIGVFREQLGQAGGQPQRAEADGGGHAQMAEHLFLGIADPRLGRFQPFRHRPGGVEQELALFGQDQPARVTVEQRRVQAFLQRADLPADRRLRQMQRVAGMRQAARIGDCMKYAQLVPIHGHTVCPNGHRPQALIPDHGPSRPVARMKPAEKRSVALTGIRAMSGKRRTP
jgi:hypothetical protein